MRSGWLVALALVGAACSGDDVATNERDDAPGSTEVPAPVTLTLATRADPALALTERGVFVWGGSGDADGDGESPDLGEFGHVYFDDGALLEAAGFVGDAIAPAPFEAPLRGSDAIVVGDEVLVTGTTCAEAADMDGSQPECRPEAHLAVAAYDPAANRWRAIDLPPELQGAGEWIWPAGATAGGTVVLHASVAGAPDVWALDVADGSWAPLEVVGSASIEGCVTGQHLVQVASQVRLSVWDLAPDEPEARFSAELPADQGYDPVATTLVCTDDAVYAVDWDGAEPLRRYDPVTDEWSRSSPPPAAEPDAFRQLTKATWSGEELIFLNTLPEEPGLAYAPGPDTWRVVEPGPIDEGDWIPDRPLWTPDGLAVWTTDGLELITVGPP
jgi:hypothetical protein